MHGQRDQGMTHVSGKACLKRQQDSYDFFSFLPVCLTETCSSNQMGMHRAAGSSNQRLEDFEAKARNGVEKTDMQTSGKAVSRLNIGLVKYIVGAVP